MNCPDCKASIPKGTPAKVGDHESGETEIQVVCPECRATIYTFTSDQFPRNNFRRGAAGHGKAGRGVAWRGMGAGYGPRTLERQLSSESFTNKTNE